MSDPRVDPVNCGNWCLEMAITEGKLRVVKVLLCDERVDPSSRSALFLGLAMASGSSIIMEELLSHEKIAIAGDETELYKWIVRNESPGLINKLIQKMKDSSQQWYVFTYIYLYICIL